MSVSKIDIFFLSKESASLFDGGKNLPRFGGAGLQMYLLGSELSKDSQFNVSFVFSNIDCSVLSHPTISVRQMKAPIRRGVPGISALINKGRIKQCYLSDNPKVIVSQVAASAPVLVAHGEAAGALTVLYLASDKDVTHPGWCTYGRTSLEVIDAMGKVDRIIAQSVWQQAELMKRYQLPSVVVKNGWIIDVNPLPIESREYVLWVASGQYLKQPWHFVEMAKHYPEVDFVMIMPTHSVGLESHIKSLVEKTTNLSLTASQVPLEQVNKLFTRAKVFVNTSEFEGFPNTFLQAGAAGVPILSLNVDPDNMITDSNLGYFASGSVVELVTALEGCLSSDDNWYQMSASVRNYVETNHDIKVIAASFSNVIMGIIGHPIT